MVAFLTTPCKANWEEIYLFLSQYDFKELYEISNLENSWTYFKDIISAAVLQFVLRISSRKHPRPKWFNSEIQHHLNQVHTLRRRHRRNPSPTFSSQLSLAEAKLSKEMSTAKQDFKFQLIWLQTIKLQQHFISTSTLYPAVINYLLSRILVINRLPLDLIRLNCLASFFTLCLLILHMTYHHPLIYLLLKLPYLMSISLLWMSSRHCKI